MEDPDTLRRLWRYKSDLEEGPDEEKLIQILKRLYKLQVSFSSLKETGIGKVVNSFRRHEGIVGEWTKKVVATWKTLLQQEVSKPEKSLPYDDKDGSRSDASQDSWTSYDGDGKKVVNSKQDKKDESRHRKSVSGAEKARDSSDHHRQHHSHSDHRNDKERYEKENSKESTSDRYQSSKDRKYKDKDKPVKTSRDHSHDNNLSEKRKDKERNQKEHRKSSGGRSSSSSGGGSRSHHTTGDGEHSYRHHKETSVKQEKICWDEDEEKTAEKNEIARVKEEKTDNFSLSKENEGEVNVDNYGSDDLTDSDVEPEQATSDVSSIEQYYKAMLGQVGAEKIHSEQNKECVESDRSKSHSLSRSTKGGEKYSAPKSSESCSRDKDGSHRDTSDQRASLSKNDKYSSSARKRKLEEDLQKGKCLKVDRKRKNHSVSESDEDEEEKDGKGDHTDWKSSSLKNSKLSSSLSHSKTSSSHHRSSSSSHHKSSSSSSIPSRKSSDLHTPSSKSSHHKSSSSHSQSSGHSKSSPSPSSFSSSKSPHHQSKSSSSSSSSSSSHHKSSSHSQPSKVNGNATKQVHTYRHYDDHMTTLPYSPNDITIKAEPHDNSDKYTSALLYTPTPIPALDKHNHHSSRNNTDSDDSDKQSDESDDSLNANKIPNSRNEKYSKDNSRDEEEMYIPNRKIKSEKLDDRKLDSETDTAYIPTKIIKKEKKENFEEKKKQSHSYSEKKMKHESGDSSSDEGDVIASTTYHSEKSRSTHRAENKYLAALHQVQSEDGDEERYSPTHGWRVKEEKTFDDHKYGGRTTSSDNNSSRGDSETDVDREKSERDKSKEHSSYDSYSDRKRGKSSESVKKIVDERGDRLSSKSKSDDGDRLSSKSKSDDGDRLSSKSKSDDGDRLSSKSKSDDGDRLSSKSKSDDGDRLSSKSKSDEKIKSSANSSRDKCKSKDCSSDTKTQYKEGQGHRSSHSSKSDSLKSHEKDKSHASVKDSSSSRDKSHSKHRGDSHHEKDKKRHSGGSRSSSSHRSDHQHVSKHEPHDPSKSKHEPNDPSKSKHEPHDPSKSKHEPHDPSKSKYEPKDPSKSKHKQSSSSESRSISSLGESKSSVKANSSPKTTKTSEHNHQKKKSKPKITPNTDAGFDLFSETIQIKKEKADSPQMNSKKDLKKHRPSSSSSSLLDKSSPSRENFTTPDTFPKRSKSSSSKMNNYDDDDDDVDDNFNSDSETATELKSGSNHGSHEKDDGNGSSSTKKKKKEAVYVDDSAMSFDDFLNFDESAVLKKSGGKGSLSKSSPTKKLKTIKSSTSNHSSAMSSDWTHSKSDTSVPRPSSDLTVTESDIMSLLPATQAHYRPIRKHPVYQDDGDDLNQETEEIGPDQIGIKTSVRSKVYSGKKHVIKELKSLHELCLHVLMDNIDAIDHVGPIPFFILKPVLERCTPQQLYRLEDCNPHFIEDSEELWEVHCKKEFMMAKREELETWRELFLRCFEEREAKYQKLKANMSKTITKGQAGRPTRLAYVDTVAKPPREVLRQQKRHGTGCVVKFNPRGSSSRTGGSFGSAKSHVVKTYRPSVTVPMYNPMNDLARTVRPTPPMMARALQMRKNMRR